MRSTNAYGLLAIISIVAAVWGVIGVIAGLIGVIVGWLTGANYSAWVLILGIGIVLLVLFGKLAKETAKSFQAKYKNWP